MIGKRGVHTPSVSARRIYVDRCRNVVAVQLGIIVDAVDGHNCMVVVRKQQAGTGRNARHLKVGTVLLLVLLMGVLAQQIVVRALMGVAL